jgi:hypothetical protein
MLLFKKKNPLEAFGKAQLIPLFLLYPKGVSCILQQTEANVSNKDFVIVNLALLYHTYSLLR